jgi:hypothetical protein
LHELPERDKEQELRFATWVTHEEGVLHNPWFSEEVYFQFDEIVNKQTI